MNNEFELIDCDNNDVLAFGDAVYKAGKFKKAVNDSFDNTALGSTLTQVLQSNGIQVRRNNWNNEDFKNWFENGIDCEILNLGSACWKSGKVKIKFSLEFYVLNDDDPEIYGAETLLDDIRLAGGET